MNHCAAVYVQPASASMALVAAVKVGMPARQCNVCFMPLAPASAPLVVAVQAREGAGTAGEFGSFRGRASEGNSNPNLGLFIDFFYGVIT